MNTQKRPLQKISSYTAKISFVLSVISAIALYLRLQDHDFNNPVSASLLACIFFFALVGVVLAIVGNTNLPSFKFEDEQPEE